MIKFLVILLPLLTSCVTLPGGTPSQKINPQTYYRHDMCFTYETNVEVEAKIKGFFRRFKKGRYRKTKTVNKKIKFCGTGVLPYLSKYNIKVESKDKMNFFTMRSCHEEATTANPNSGIFKKGNYININYEPTIEKGEACPVHVVAYSKGRKHTTGLIVFENPAYQLLAKVHCNGYVTEALGVSICHSREGLVQRLDFQEPVAIGEAVQGPADRTANSPKCPKLPLTKNKRSTGLFKLPSRECVYPVIGLTSGKIHQFYAVGYEAIIIRE